MIQRFKKKWNIQTNLQLVVIIIVFSLTGSAALLVRKFAFKFLGIVPETPLLIKIPLYILILVPSYQVLLLLIGGLLGQFRFFYAFQKKSLLSLKFRNKNNDRN